MVTSMSLIYLDCYETALCIKSLEVTFSVTHWDTVTLNQTKNTKTKPKYFYNFMPPNKVTVSQTCLSLELFIIFRTDTE